MVEPHGPGIGRRQRGKSFSFHDLDTDTPIEDAATLDRVQALVLPPAWRDVWISARDDGHIQAVGTDAAGRRQYRYHAEWDRQRAQEKFLRVARLGSILPDVRGELEARLGGDGLDRGRVMAGAVWLLDLGVFRVGGEEYASGDDASFGLATLLRAHVTVGRAGMAFDYIAKSGKRRRLLLHDEDAEPVVRGLKRRRDLSPGLLAWRAGGRGGQWHDVNSTDVNGYVHEVVGPDTSAKDFRTWHGTVIAAVELADRKEAANTDSKRKRAVSATMKAVSSYLGNTPAVARSSYVDPRLVDLFNDGITIDPALTVGKHDLAGGTTHGKIEEAVHELLTHTKRELRKELPHLQ